MTASPMNFSIVAAVPLELGAHLVEVARHHLPERLRVERLAEGRRALQVGEDDRHDLAVLLCRAGVRERRPTGEAELRNRRVLDAAGSARLHDPSLRGTAARNAATMAAWRPISSRTHASSSDATRLLPASSRPWWRCPTPSASLRERIGELQGARSAFPGERERLLAQRGGAEEELARSTAELEQAEARLAELESSRRRREDDLQRAAKEAATARDVLADARTHVDRVAGSLAQLEASERDVEREEVELAGRAEALAAEIGSLRRSPAPPGHPGGVWTHSPSGRVTPGRRSSSRVACSSRSATGS